MRIRSTKPEFWRSERIASVDWEDRLVLKGLESYVDDNGVGKDDIALIVGDLFQRDLVREPSRTLARVSEALTRLHAAGLLHRYEHDGTHLLYLSFWESFQRIDKATAGRLPRPDGTLNYGDSQIGAPLANPRESSRALVPGTGEQGNRGTGHVGTEEQGTDARETRDAAPPLVIVDTGPTFDDFWNAYPRKADKPAASRAWKNAIKKADPALIVDAAARYRDDPNRVDQFTKFPGPWLNAEAWNNPPLPPRDGGRPESSFDRVVRQHQEAAAQLAAEETTNGRQGSTRPALPMGHRRPA